MVIFSIKVNLYELFVGMPIITLVHFMTEYKTQMQQKSANL